MRKSNRKTRASFSVHEIMGMPINLHLHEVRGKHLSAIEIVDLVGERRTVKTITQVPGEGTSQSYFLKTPAKRVSSEWLVLDACGNRRLTPRLYKKLGLGNEPSQVTLAIHRGTGDLYKISYRYTGRFYVACLVPIQSTAYRSLRIPERYLSRLDELKGSSNPFHFTLDASDLMAFMEREASYKDLRKNLVVYLDFRPWGLELKHNRYREVCGP